MNKNLINGCDFNDDKTINYIKLFSSLPNFNFNKEIVIDDFYNPTLYKWDGNWIVSWISDEGDSLLDFTGSTPEEVIKKAVEYIKEHYQVSIEEKSQPLFTLTAEEVEIVKELCYGKFTLSTFPSDYEKKIRHLYDRIEQYQEK